MLNGWVLLRQMFRCSTSLCYYGVSIAHVVLCSDSEKCFSLFADYFNLEHVASVFKMNPDITAYIWVVNVTILIG